MSTEALQDADILGIVSAHRLVRDANVLKIARAHITGRALFAYVEALNTTIDLSEKIVTEDRVHTLVYTRRFLEEMIAVAERVVVVGGLGPIDMQLPTIEKFHFIPLIPEQNKGLPTSRGARSIVENYEYIAQELAENCSPGTVALISGGYVGKGFFVATFQERIELKGSRCVIIMRAFGKSRIILSI